MMKNAGLRKTLSAENTHASQQNKLTSTALDMQYFKHLQYAAAGSYYKLRH